VAVLSIFGLGMGMADATYGKESLDKFCEFFGGHIAVFVQKVMHKGDTLLQGLELFPFHNTKLGILHMPFIDGSETTVQPTEIINPHEF
jgi:hypothetical protein